MKDKKQFFTTDRLELNVVDGIILPNLKMDASTDACTFLDENGNDAVPAEIGSADASAFAHDRPARSGRGFRRFQGQSVICNTFHSQCSLCKNPSIFRQ